MIKITVCKKSYKIGDPVTVNKKQEFENVEVNGKYRYFKVKENV